MNATAREHLKMIMELKDIFAKWETNPDELKVLHAEKIRLQGELTKIDSIIAKITGEPAAPKSLFEKIKAATKPKNVKSSTKAVKPAKAAKAPKKAKSDVVKQELSEENILKFIGKGAKKKGDFYANFKGGNVKVAKFLDGMKSKLHDEEVKNAKGAASRIYTKK